MRLSKHAERMERKRGISLDDCEHAMSHRLGPQSSGSAPNTVETVGWTPAGRIIKVVTDRDDPSLVVTMMWEEG